MKYLFINSFAGWGSTGRICVETCEELMAQGHQCLIAYGRKKGDCRRVPTLRIGSDLCSKINGLGCRILDNDGFGLRGPTRKLIKQIRDYDPDVIWLHNLHGYYLHVGLLFDYLRTCGKPIYWTLHDCWTLTGHCAYFDHVGCEKWKTQCSHCPEKHEYPAALLLDGSRRNHEKKKQAFRGIPDLHLITPSQWLADRVKLGLLREYPVEVRYNRVDETVFKPTPGDFRERYGLRDRKILLGVASVWDSRKGLSDFVELAGMLEPEYKIVLVGLSEKQIAAMPESILALPRTENVRQLTEIYTAADLYLNPSVDETFGMTVLEATRCGTPAVVYEGTACQEVVALYGGTAVPRGARHLYEAVKSLI